MVQGGLSVLVESAPYRRSTIQLRLQLETVETNPRAWTQQSYQYHISPPQASMLIPVSFNVYSVQSSKYTEYKSLGFFYYSTAEDWYVETGCDDHLTR